MQLIVNNTVASDIIVSIDKTDYTVKAGDKNLSFDLTDNRHFIKVKRAKLIPPPDFKKAFWTEFLGIFSILFFKPWFYVFDISSAYVLDANEDCVYINIVREEKNATEGIYDVIKAKSASSGLKTVKYTAENETEIVTAYKKTQKAVHAWTYFIAEVIFTLLGMVIFYPILLVIYAAMKSTIIIFLLITAPIFIIGFIALIVILPLHFLYKYQDNNFYRNMQSEEIYTCLEKKEATSNFP